MANPEHLKILKQGVEVWNQWREEHPDEKVDLRGTKLRETDLSGANLRKTNLRGVDLCKANLRRADLSEADLTGINLSEADLGGAILYGAHLTNARLINTILREAVLIGASLNHSDMSQADLQEAQLSQANLNRTNLHSACLANTNLRFAQLSLATLTNATLTGAYLYGTARDDWKIDDIRCDYVFWEDKPVFLSDNNDAQEQQWEAAHRTPKDRNFRPGEFEELYKSLPTFEYVFEHGFTPIDALVMDQVVQTINQQNPEYEVKLTTLDSRGQPHAVFTVISKDYVEPARKQITTDYEARLAALEGKQEQMMELFARVVNNPQLIVTGDLTIGDKRMIQAGRDYVEKVEGDVTTGASSHDDQKEGETEGETGESEPLTSEGQSTQ